MSGEISNVDYIKSWYPSKGAHWLAEKLDLSIGYVRAVAYEQGVQLGKTYAVRKGRYVLVNELAWELGGASPQGIVKAAARDGVLRRTETGDGSPDRLMVPKAWANARREEHREAQENEYHYGAYYLTPIEAAQQLGVGRTTLRKYLAGKRDFLGRYLADVHIVRGGWSHGGYRRWLLDPRGIDAARRQLDADREMTRTWVSVKSLVIETGISRQSLGRYIRDRDDTRLLLHGQRLARFVSPALAAEIRDYYGLREAA